MKKFAVVVALIIAVTAAAWALYHRDGKLQPVSRAEGLKLLAQVRKANKKNQASIRNGCGRIIIQQQSNFPESIGFEQKLTLDLSFSSPDYKAKVIQHSHQNKQPSKTFIQRLKDFSQQLTKPGTTKPAPGPRSIHSNITGIASGSIYIGNRKSFTSYTPKKKQAQIINPESPQASAAYMSPAYITGIAIAMIRTNPLYKFKAGKINNHFDMQITYSEPVVIGRQRIDGNDCIVIEQHLDYQSTKHKSPQFNYSLRHRHWICPSKNYRVIRSETWGCYPGYKRTGEMLIDTTSKDVKEYKPGVWGATGVSSTGYGVTNKGRIYKQSQYSVTCDPSFQLNVPKSKLDLKLKLPKGTRVDDQVKHRHYVVK